MKILSIPICFLVVLLWSEIQCMEEQTRNDESIVNNQEQLFEFSNSIPQKLTSVELTNLDDTVDLYQRNVSTSCMQSLGGNAMCSLSYILGATLGFGGGLCYLYIHLGFEITNGALSHLVTPLSTGLLIGSVIGCGAGYFLKKYVEREKKYV